MLGADERGDRASSVPRLHRLSRLYRVPIDRMMPTDDGPGIAPAADDGETVDFTHTATTRHDDPRVAIDLVAVEQLATREDTILARYLYSIQIQRGDHCDRVLTIRPVDLTPIAGIIGCRPDQVTAARHPRSPPTPPDPRTPRTA